MSLNTIKTHLISGEIFTTDFNNREQIIFTGDGLSRFAFGKLDFQLHWPAQISVLLGYYFVKDNPTTNFDNREQVILTGD